MALPKVSIPIFELTIPSIKKMVKFRPFLVKEEKILLIAQQSKSDTDILNALKQIINNCVQETNFDVDDLTTFDLEYMFLKIRAKSVENIVKLKYFDHEDEQTYEVEVNLDEIEVDFDPKNNKIIKVDDTIGIVMKYPSPTIVNKIADKDSSEVTNIVIKDCIESIYDGDSIFKAREADPAELDEFIDNLNVKTFDAIQEFFDTIPKLKHTVRYTNSKGTDREIELSTLQDFFTLR